jgi:hypothetical protein
MPVLFRLLRLGLLQDLATHFRIDVLGMMEAAQAMDTSNE